MRARSIRRPLPSLRKVTRVPLGEMKTTPSTLSRIQAGSTLGTTSRRPWAETASAQETGSRQGSRLSRRAMV